MPDISPVMLNDTLNLIQLARETAKIQGQKAQAERLTPVVDNLRSIVSEARETKPAAPSGVLAQDDFRTLLNTVQTRPNPTQSVGATSTSSFTDRTQMVMMMSAGGMSELDIARQMGMTRDEIQLITSINRRTPGMEVIK
jgi:hypothetical protein